MPNSITRIPRSLAVPASMNKGLPARMPGQMTREARAIPTRHGKDRIVHARKTSGNEGVGCPSTENVCVGPNHNDGCYSPQMDVAGTQKTTVDGRKRPLNKTGRLTLTDPDPSATLQYEYALDVVQLKSSPSRCGLSTSSTSHPKGHRFSTGLV